VDGLAADVLAEEALAGHAHAWQALIQQHNQRVVVSLLACGVPVARAKELAHDAWSRLVEQQRLGRLPRLELPGLAIRQARFLWLDETRRRHGDGDEALAQLADPAPNAEERFVSRAQLARAQATLATLPESAQRVFRLIYENPGIAHADAAAQVGLSVQRVRQILCEVRKQLRAALED
jgi:RNA polymerase sigma factor (sigma-70 family)